MHRALTCIPGETTLAVNFGMQEQYTMEILSQKSIFDLNDSCEQSAYQFRAPTVGDADIWADIYNDAFAGCKSAENVIHEFNGHNFSPNLYIICVNESGNPVGSISSFHSGTHARIPTIAVRREWQGKGIGKALLSETLRRLKKIGAEDVRLSVDSNNRAAKSLYTNYITHFLL